jgi:hypothetical protein
MVYEGLWGCIDISIKNIRRDMRVRGKICFMVKPNIYTHVQAAKSAKEAWTIKRKPVRIKIK